MWCLLKRGRIGPNGKGWYASECDGGDVLMGGLKAVEGGKSSALVLKDLRLAGLKAWGMRLLID